MKANAGERVAKINVKQMTTQRAAFVTLPLKKKLDNSDDNAVTVCINFTLLNNSRKIFGRAHFGSPSSASGPLSRMCRTRSAGSPDRVRYEKLVYSFAA